VPLASPGLSQRGARRAAGSGWRRIRGAGTDIYGAADSFHFVYRKLTGDGTITARVTGIENTYRFAKAGVMMRESLAANSKQAGTFALPGTGGVSYVRRKSTGGSTVATTHAPLGAPCWVRIVRRGNVFTSYRSADGVKWQFIGSDTINMSATLYVGLAVCSHNLGALNTATFDHVSVTPG